MTNKKKVYCEDCRYYFNDDIHLNGEIDKCNCPNNIFEGDTYKHRFKYAKIPCCLNEKNDCKWFEKRKHEKM